MKSKEEIEQLAEIAFKDELIKSNQNINWIGYGKGIDGTSKERWIELWIKGYTQCQEDMADKKFTLNDMKKACAIGIDIAIKEGPNDFQPFEDYINSLNKKD